MIEVQELRSWLGVSDGKEDTLLQDLEKRALAFIEKETGRYFGEPKTITQVLDGHGFDVLWLDEAPITITSISWRNSLSNDWTVYAATEYEQDGRQVFKLLGENWPAGRRNIKVIYTAGYDAGEEPQDIRQSVLDLVALKYQGRGSEALHSQRIGDYSYTRGDITNVPGLHETLARWRYAWLG